MSQSERKEAILDNIGLQEGDSVFVIGCEKVKCRQSVVEKCGKNLG